MFIFYFLGVRLPCHSIFCQFWLCEEAQCVYLCRHLGSLQGDYLNYYSSPILFFFQDSPGCAKSFAFLHTLQSWFSVSAHVWVSVFVHTVCLLEFRFRSHKSVDHFGGELTSSHFGVFLNHERGIFLHLFRSSLISPRNERRGQYKKINAGEPRWQRR